MTYDYSIIGRHLDQDYMHLESMNMTKGLFDLVLYTRKFGYCKTCATRVRVVLHAQCVNIFQCAFFPKCLPLCGDNSVCLENEWYQHFS